MKFAPSNSKRFKDKTLATCIAGGCFVTQELQIPPKRAFSTSALGPSRGAATREEMRGGAQLKLLEGRSARVGAEAWNEHLADFLARGRRR